MSEISKITSHLFPFAPHYFDRGDGLRMHYVDEGTSTDGEAVVMVHGNPTWSFYYRALIDALRPSRRVIALDHIGCGKSDKPPLKRYRYRLRDRIEDLEGLLNHLGFDRITLIVHDWGGMIGMGFAVRNPARIERIVALNTAAFHLPKNKSLPRSIAVARTPLIGDVLIRGASAFSHGANRSCVTEIELPRNVKRAYLAPYDSWKHRLAVHRFIKDIPLSASHPSYATVSEVAEGLSTLKNHPMLIAWGMRDFVFDRHFLAEWEKRFPNAYIHRFGNSGHYILEDARDEVTKLVADFVSVPKTQDAAL